MTEHDCTQLETNTLLPDAETRTLETLLSIYPVLSTLAANLPAGDLISLSRTSTTIRNLTHGFPIDHPSTSPPHHPNSNLPNQPRNFLTLHLGNHQSPQWASLKSLSSFTCSSSFHVTPKPSATNPANITKACKFCSRPVCRTCLIRSFFADPSSSKNTFRYRTRYLCTGCWETGNLRRDFRYPCESISWEQVWHGRWYGQRGGRCCCSASADNWVCLGCRSLQNTGGPGNRTLWEAERESVGMIERNRKLEAGEWPDISELRCYGLGCTNQIEPATKDRRRICLWCSKSLPRPFGGEDRLRWEEKQLEIRAAAAASRSADIQEWARNRFRSLTMSRREMRGTDECILLTGRDGREHDAPIFVKHLDACNYRQFMGDEKAPSPASVYQSKYGRWTYSIGFLKHVNGRSGGRHALPTPPGVDAMELFETTKASGFTMARRNLDLRSVDIPRLEDLPHSRRVALRKAIIFLLPRLHAAGIMNEQEVLSFPQFRWLNTDKLEILLDKLFEKLKQFEQDDDDGTSATRESAPFQAMLAESGGFIGHENTLRFPTANSGERPPEHTDADVPQFEDVPFETEGHNSASSESQVSDTDSQTSTAQSTQESRPPAQTDSEESQTHTQWFGQPSTSKVD